MSGISSKEGLHGGSIKATVGPFFNAAIAAVSLRNSVGDTLDKSPFEAPTCPPRVRIVTLGDRWFGLDACPCRSNSGGCLMRTSTVFGGTLQRVNRFRQAIPLGILIAPMRRPA
jgi:hypothetical protein